ncbi:oligosaccharide flippase family protein [Natrialbaceae archaeon A-CW3]
MNIGKTSTVVFICKIIGSIFSFVAMIYFARLLGSGVIGQYSLILALVAWLQLIGKMGVATALKKRLSEGDDRPQFLTTGLLLIFVISIPVLITLFLLSNPLSSYMGASYLFLVFVFPISMFFVYVESALKGDHKVHLFGILYPSRKITQSIIQLALVFFLGFGLTGMVVGYGVAAVLVGIFGLYLLKPEFNMPRKHHFESIFSYAKYSWMGSLKSRSYNDADILILGIFVSPSLVGIYAIAWTIASFMNIFGEAISNALFPEISFQSSNSQQERVSKLVSLSLSYTGLMIIPGLVGAAIIGENLLLLYGDEFVFGTKVLVLLVLCCAIYGYQKQLLNALNAIDRPDLSLKSNFIFIISNISLNIILISQFSLVGAAVATLISASLGSIISYYYLNRLIEITFPFKSVLNQSFAALLMGGVVFGIHNMDPISYYNIPNTVYVILIVTFGAVLYFSLLIFLWKEFRMNVMKNIPQLI